jgi:hypothetical protein
MRTIIQAGVETGLSVTTGAAVALTMPTGPTPTHAIIQVVTNSIRYTSFGTAPTSTIGILVPAGANIEFMDGTLNYMNVIERFRAIGISGTATLNVAYYYT